MARAHGRRQTAAINHAGPRLAALLDMGFFAVPARILNSTKPSPGSLKRHGKTRNRATACRKSKDRWKKFYRREIPNRPAASEADKSRSGKQGSPEGSRSPRGDEQGDVPGAKVHGRRRPHRDPAGSHLRARREGPLPHCHGRRRYMPQRPPRSRQHGRASALYRQLVQPAVDAIDLEQGMFQPNRMRLFSLATILAHDAQWESAIE